MIHSRHYNIIVPSIDYNGPVTLLLDLGRRAVELDYEVTVYYLNSYIDSSIIDFNAEVKKLEMSDFKNMKGVVHSTCIKPDFVNFLIRTLNRNVFSVTTIPSFLYEDMKYDYNKWLAWITWRAWSLFSGILDSRVVLSKTMQKYYATVAPSMTNDVIYHSRRADQAIVEVGENVEKIRVQKKNYKYNLVFVAGLRPRKNLIKLIEEVYKFNDVSLTIFGDGPQRKLVEALVDVNTDQVMYLGHDSKAYTYLDLFDALVLPSFAEGLPTVVLEAIQRKCFCLLSDIAVHRELCSLGVGVICDHEKFSDFYQKIKEIKLMSKDAQAIEHLNRSKLKYFDHNNNFDMYQRVFSRR